MNAADVTVADVAAVLDGAAMGKFGACLTSCPLCHKPKGTQIFQHEGLMVVDRLCQCTLKAVRAEVMARFADRRGAELELFTPVEAKQKAKANGHDKTNGHEKGPFAGPIADDLYRHVIDEPIVPPPVLVADLVPDKCLVVLAGRGGAGKGITSQMLATCVASIDKKFLERMTEHGSAVFFTTEDRKRTLLNRQDRICRALGIERSDVADRLVLKSFREADCCLFKDGQPTSLMHIFEAWLKGLPGLRLVVLDSAALVYGDDENDRHAVTTFLRYLDLMAERLGCTIVLITHTSRTSDGSVERMTSGSTAWVNQARAALLLSVDADKAVSLVLRKSNELKPDVTVELLWSDDGVLLAKDMPVGVLAQIQRRKDDELVLTEVTKRWEDPDAEPLCKGRNMGDRYLPFYMQRQRGLAANRAEAAMVRLLDAVKISTAEKRRHLSGLKPVSHEKK